jgi:hypothetical protein
VTAEAPGTAEASAASQLAQSRCRGAVGFEHATQVGGDSKEMSNFGSTPPR